jgi:hypothetical protein
MSIAQRIQLWLGVALDLAGLSYAAFSLWYLSWLGLLIALGPLLCATFLAIRIRPSIPKRLFVSITLPALVVGVVFLVGNLYANIQFLVWSRGT